MTLVDTGTECSLIYGKQEQFPGPSAHIDGYGDQTVKAVSLPLEIEQVPVWMYTVCVSPIPMTLFWE